MHLVIDARCLHRSMGGIGHATRHLVDHLCRSRRPADRMTLLVGPNLPDQIAAPGATFAEVHAGMIDPHFEQHHLPHVLEGLGADVYLNMTFSVPSVPGLTAQIAVIHDVVFEERPDLVELQLCAYLQRWSRVSAAIAERIITVSEDARKRIQRRLQVDDARIVSIHNGMVPVKNVRANDPAVLDALTRHRLRPPYLLYIGSIEPKKGLAQLLTAFSDPLLERSYRSLALVGGNSGPASDLDEQMRQHRRAGDIRRLGYVSEQDKQLLLAGAQAFVYPSLYEGFGLPPLEALAHGVPCVVHADTSLPEVVGDVGLVVDVLNPALFASALHRAAQDDDLRKRVRRLGPSHAGQFRWDATAEQYWAVCRQVWSEHQASRQVA